MVGVFEGLVQLLSLTPQVQALQHLGGCVPLLLAAVLRYHLPLYGLQLLIGEVLHQHGLEHLRQVQWTGTMALQTKYTVFPKWV